MSSNLGTTDSRRDEVQRGLRDGRMARYSLRGLLLFVTVSAIFVSLMVPWMTARLDQQTREHLQREQDLFWRSTGYSVLRKDHSQPEIVLALDLPSSRYAIRDLKLPDSITTVVIRRGVFDDETAVGLDTLPNLKLLVVMDTAITDDAMRIISNCRRVRVLNIMNNRGISDASVDLIAAMGELEVVYIEGAGISRDGAKRLREKLEDAQVIGR